jgi:hypothetical protein
MAFLGRKPMRFIEWLKVKLGIIPTYPKPDPLIDKIMLRFGWVRYAELEDLRYRFGCFLDLATGGRMSKTTYTVLEMGDCVEDYIEDRIKQSAALIEDDYKEGGSLTGFDAFSEEDHYDNPIEGINEESGAS